MYTDLRSGQDIAAARWDWLDISCIRYAARLKRRITTEHTPVAVDLGCGQGLMALTLQDMGYRAIACDLRITDTIRVALGDGAYEGDFRIVPWAGLPAPDTVYSQRALHYIPYTEAVSLLTTLTRKPGCAAFISLAGYHSELGNGYPDQHRPVQERFAPLAPEPQRTTDISAPLCLYKPDDAALLIAETGLAVTGLWSSEFGNIKIMAARDRTTPYAGKQNKKAPYVA